MPCPGRDGGKDSLCSGDESGLCPGKRGGDGGEGGPCSGDESGLCSGDMGGNSLLEINEEAPTELTRSGPELSSSLGTMIFTSDTT